MELLLSEDFVTQAETAGLQPVELWTDGSGTLSSSQAGAGIVAISKHVKKEWSIQLPEGTSNFAELSAVREGLLRVKDRPGSWVRVFTDSEYVAGALAPGCTWFLSKNVELVLELRKLSQECGFFEVHTIPGHSGYPYNERADKLAGEARVQAKREATEYAIHFNNPVLKAAWMDLFRRVLIEHGVFKPPVIERPRESTEPVPEYFDDALREWDRWADVAA